MNPVRVRFAPSPTGSFHIGGARTALYNFLLARQTGGQFILRIEDTDQKRSDPKYQAEIMEALAWLGIRWDEGPEVGGPHAPYNQLARRAIYQEHAEQLIASGHAYACFCTPQRLQQVRESHQKLRQQPHYDGTCRAVPPAEAAARREAEPHVIRFKTPKEGSTTVHDHLRGDITIDNRNIDDYILVKSDGLALYHLAAMVDDHMMGITHVIRGDEWLPSLPLHALIYRASGWTEPVWCHLSVFLKPSGKGKMSKRDVNSEQSIFVLGLRDLGYTPDAILNWIALMGWSYDDKAEFFTLDDLIAKFSLDSLNPIQGRTVTLDDVVQMAGFFFRDDISPAPPDLLPKGLTPETALTALDRSREILASLPNFDHSTTEPAMRALADELGLKPGQLFGLLRAAVTGQTVSPPLFETMEVVGKRRTLARLSQAMGLLEASNY
ncbi:MAG: glutamate--tRNA ligase [Chloroflexi bacterium]|nr:glutamate--tRNA ligase [Chloroflexota bacterium]